MCGRCDGCSAAEASRRFESVSYSFARPWRWNSAMPLPFRSNWRRLTRHALLDRIPYGLGVGESVPRGAPKRVSRKVRLGPPIRPLGCVPVERTWLPFTSSDGIHRGKISRHTSRDASGNGGADKRLGHDSPVAAEWHIIQLGTDTFRTFRPAPRRETLTKQYFAPDFTPRSGEE